MTDDPYRVLGVSPGASQEEIKKAYRRKVKEYHPDLHPGDPAAAQKTNEINEAYDMLQNPEKYEARRRQQQNAYGPSGHQTQSAYGSSGQQSGTRGAGGWTEGFGFDDFFGFGFGGSRNGDGTVPEPRADDSPEIRSAVSAIRSGAYQQAVRILMQVPGMYRNARWHYLSALADRGLGSSSAAMEHMRRAVQLEPGSGQYRRLLQQLDAEEQARSASGGPSGVFHPPDIGKSLIMFFNQPLSSMAVSPIYLLNSASNCSLSGR